MSNMERFDAVLAKVLAYKPKKKRATRKRKPRKKGTKA